MVILQVGSTPTAAAAGTITVEETYPTRYLPNTDRPTLGKRRVGLKKSKTIYKTYNRFTMKEEITH